MIESGRNLVGYCAEGTKCASLFLFGVGLGSLPGIHIGGPVQRERTISSKDGRGDHKENTEYAKVKKIENPLCTLYPLLNCLRIDNQGRT